MNRPMNGGRGLHWAQLNEFSFIAGMRLIHSLCRVFGRWPVRALLYPVALWYMITKPAARSSSKTYLQRVAAYSPAAQIRPGLFAVWRHFASFADSILDKLLLWSGFFDTDGVEFYGEEQIAAQIVAKQGGLLICSHLGNLELCRVMSKKRAGLKMTVLIHTKHARKFNRLLARLDPASQIDLMQVSEISAATAVLLAEKVARGEFIAIAGDRVPISVNPRVALAKFLGASAPFPIGPYILAGLLHCPVFLLFTIRNGRTSLIHVERFRETVRLPRQGRDAALAALVADYAGRLEHFCLRAPLQWFNFYDFWQTPGMDTQDAIH